MFDSWMQGTVIYLSFNYVGPKLARNAFEVGVFSYQKEMPNRLHLKHARKSAQLLKENHHRNDKEIPYSSFIKILSKTKDSIWKSL